MKKFLVIFITTFFSLSGWASFYVNGIKYDIIGTNTVQVSSGGTYTGNIEIPSTVTYSNVTYSVKAIGDNAFADCQFLISVNLPSSVTRIGTSAFKNCLSLKSINIPSSVTSIGAYAFSGCNSISSIVIPSSVVSIEEYTFRGCNSLTSITIPLTVTTIRDGAFYCCNSLTSITIPSSVTSMGNYVFYGCLSLKSITIPPLVTYIGNLAFYQCFSLTSITIPSSVTQIGYQAFHDCNSLKYLTLPSSLSYIGDNAFTNCHSITSITIPSSVTYIGKYVFGNCKSLLSLTIPSSVTSIGDYAFSNCSSLTLLSLPSTVTSIGYEAFSYCTKLKKIIIFTKNPPILGTKSFHSVNIDTLFIPKGSKNTYLSNSNWNIYKNLDEMNVSTVKLINVACQDSVKINTIKLNFPYNGEVKYKWTPSTGLNCDTIPNPNIAILQDTAIYTVIATLDNGYECSNILTIINKKLEAYAGTDKSLICGGSIQIDSVKTNYIGEGKLLYKWTTPEGLNNDTIANPIATITSDMQYTVTVTTPNGCVAYDTLVIKVNPLTANAGKDKSLICGGSVQLDSVTTNYTGNGRLKYKWTPNTGLDNDTIANPIATITENTTYIVEVTTPNGCTAYDSVSVEVKPLIANAGKDKSLICGGSVQLDSVTTKYTGNGELKYKWTPNIGLDNDTISNPTVTLTENQTYTVEIATQNGCIAYDSVFVEVKPLQVNAGKDQFVVCGDSVQLITNSNYTGVELLKYKWEPSDGLNNDSISNPLVYSLVETDYRLTITTPNGCSAIDSVKIKPTVSKHQEIRLVGVNENKNMIVWNKINEKNIDSVYVYKETSVTDIYKKIGVSPYSQMYFTDTTSNPVVVSSKYQISLKDKCGFETESSNPHKTIHLAIVKGQGNTWNLIWEPYTGFTVATYKIYRGMSLNALFLLYEASGSVYQYYDNNPPAGDVYYQIEVVPPTNQLYQSNSGFMKISNSVNLSTSRSNIATNNIIGIENISYNLFEVYPNPAKDMVQLILNYSSPSIVKIYNSTGQVIKTFETSSSFNINVSDIPNNLYIIEVCTGLKYEKQKLVINR